MIPNLIDLVRQTAVDYPEAWANAHTGNANTEDFIRILAARAHAMYPQFGLNGKRGNPNDLSDDALNYVGEGGGRTPDGLPCSVIDVISAAGSPSAAPAWQVFSNPPEANGAWVRPADDAEVPEPEPEPEPPHVCPPCQTLSRDEALDEMNWLDGYYRSQEGLQRPEGLSIDGKPDFLGIAAWYCEVYERERITNKKSRADARAVYVNDIRHSEEWQRKHPGETP